MRNAFFATLADLAGHEERIVLLTGDLGFSVIEQFADRFPSRFINVGVAEQNMVGIATGMAEAGYIPFVYSIATFAALRPFEFIRNGPVAHRSPVRIVGVGGGFEYGTAGMTHHALEDLAVMRTQPGLTVIAPSDHRQAATAVRATWDLDGPIYYRLGKNDRREVSGLDGTFELGRVEVVGQGTDLVLVSTGAIAAEAVDALALLRADGISATALILPTIAPVPTAALADLLAPFDLVMSVEAHYVTGGLGSLAAEVIAECGLGARLVRVGVDGLPDGKSGSEAYLNEQHGLTAAQIATRACLALGSVRMPR
jgi:transketolase